MENNFLKFVLVFTYIFLQYGKFHERMVSAICDPSYDKCKQDITFTRDRLNCNDGGDGDQFCHGFCSQYYAQDSTSEDCCKANDRCWCGPYTSGDGSGDGDGSISESPAENGSDNSSSDEDDMPPTPRDDQTLQRLT